MLVNTHLMYLGKDCFVYSDKVNKAIMELLPEKFYPRANSLEIKQGYFPQYDAIVKGNNSQTTFEVKVTTKQNGVVNIELGTQKLIDKPQAWSDFKGSALSETTSDYYVFLHKNYNGDKQIGKLRIIPTASIKAIVNDCLQKGQAIHQGVDDPKSYYITIKFGKDTSLLWEEKGLLPADLHDGWMADIDVTSDGFFDTDQVIRRNKQYYS